MKTNQIMVKSQAILIVLILFISGCKEGDNDFRDLKVITDNSPVKFSIDGIISLELNKQSLKWRYYDNFDEASEIIEDTSQLLLTVKNLLSEDITNLNFWIIGYNSPLKRKEDINFIYLKTVPALSYSIDLGAITNTYSSLGESLTYRFFDAEVSSFDEFDNNEFAGLYNTAVSFFKNDTVEIGATTGICQVNYLGQVKFQPDDRNTFTEFTGIVTNNGNFYGDIETMQGTTTLINADTAAFKINEDRVSAIIVPEKFIQDTITRIDLNMSKFQTVNQ